MKKVVGGIVVGLLAICLTIGVWHNGNCASSDGKQIKVDKLSQKHVYYEEVKEKDPDSVNYIKEITMYDRQIDDDFVIHVSLPPEYDASKKYPMVVMTDGVWRLSDHVELRPFMGQTIEPLILVSVGYPDGYDYENIRERDLVTNPGEFLHFIVDDVVPYLESQYSVDKDNLMLTGHSYGGFWGFYALFHEDDICHHIFRNYYIGSPSLQASTDGKTIEDFEREYFVNHDELDCNVYITVGREEEKDFRDPINDFVTMLHNRHYKSLNLKYEVIDGYDHDTVFKPSIKNALEMYYGM